MNKAIYTYWQDDGMWLGYLDEFPDYMTQATSLVELEENLLDFYRDLASAQIPLARRQGELSIG